AGVAVGGDLHEADPLQSLQGLAHRCPRDAQRLGQLAVAQPLAGGQATVADGCAEHGVHLVTEDCTAGLQRREGELGTHQTVRLYASHLEARFALCKATEESAARLIYRLKWQRRATRGLSGGIRRRPGCAAA